MGKKWPVQMNLPYFAVKAYAPGGGPESGRKKKSKNAFRPVQVQKLTFPVKYFNKKCLYVRNEKSLMIFYHSCAKWYVTFLKMNSLTNSLVYVMLFCVNSTMRAGMIAQLIPQQLLMCNWCAVQLDSSSPGIIVV